MKKNRLQRLKEDIDKDVQNQLDENTVDTTPKPGQTNELNFWVKIISIFVAFGGFYTVAQWLGELLGYKQVYVQYGIIGVLGLALIVFYVWLRRKYR